MRESLDTLRAVGVAGVSHRVASGTSGADAIAGYDLRWHVLALKPHLRHSALSGIARIGYPVHVHMLAVRKIPTEIVRTPAFGSYVFVRFDAATQPWVALLHVVGVQAMIRFPDGRPKPLPRGWVEGLIAQGDTETTATRRPVIQRGDAVEITSGPLAGLRGAAILDEGARVRVLLTLMGRQMEVPVPEAQVVVA